MTHVFFHLKLLFYSAPGIFLGEHKWSSGEELGPIFETAVLWQQGPIYIGRVLNPHFAELHDYGGKFLLFFIILVYGETFVVCACSIVCKTGCSEELIDFVRPSCFLHRTSRQWSRAHPHIFDAWHSQSTRASRSILPLIWPDMLNALPLEVFPLRYALGVLLETSQQGLKCWKRIDSLVLSRGSLYFIWKKIFLETREQTR